MTILRRRATAVLISVALTASCAPMSTYSPARTIDARTEIAGVSGIGIESQDLISMTDRMVRDLLSSPHFLQHTRAPRIIIDDRRLKNESAQPMNMAMLSDRLRIDLMRSAAGRFIFVSRENADLVESERDLKRDGTVDAGVADTSRRLLGADYILVGRLASQSSASQRTGMRSNFFQITFELLDLSTSQSVWGNMYEVKKAGSDDPIYRN